MSVSMMKKLTVLTSERDADALVRRLMRMRCVQIRTLSPDEGEDGEGLTHPDCDIARVESERRVRDVSEAITLLDRYADKQKPWFRPGLSSYEGAFRLTGSYEKAWETVRETLRLWHEMEDCRAEHARLCARLDSLIPWMAYNAPLDADSTDTCRIWLGVLPSKMLLSTVDDALHDCHAGVEEVARDKDGLYVSVVFLKEDEEAVNRALSPLGFLRADFASAGVTGTVREAYKKANKHRTETEAAIEACEKKQRELSAFVEDLEILYDMETTTLYAVQERQKLLSTGQCVVLEGWVPQQRVERVRAALDRLDCAYELSDPAEEDEPPVLLKNNGYAANFEWVVGMYSYPKYGTYDPTFIMSIFYFVIFGLMFADVGYGMLLLLAGFLAPRLLHMKEGMTRMLNMFGYCGIACTLLGVVFGGWFGDMPYSLMVNMFGMYDSVEAAKAAVPFFNGLVVTLGGTPMSLNPLEEPMVFLVISLIMGAIHLLAGMAVKFVLLCKSGDVVAAIFDIGSWWVLFAGIGFIFIVPTVGYVLCGVGVLMLITMSGRAHKNIAVRLLMGLKSLYDVVSYASDLLSYCRILALGLAAGVIAQVVNLIATMGGPSVGGFIIMVLVFLLGHVLNMAINLLGAFVHTSRLQYLEFFNKFFVDGGEAFQPALPSEKYTTLEEVPTGSSSDGIADV